MSVQGLNQSSLAKIFNAHVEAASVNEHISKSQISSMLKGVKNTPDKLTETDYTSIKKSIGYLRFTLQNQNSKMRAKKESNLDKVEKRVDSIYPKQLQKEAVANAIPVINNANSNLHRLTDPKVPSALKPNEMELRTSLTALEGLDKSQLDIKTGKKIDACYEALRKQLSMMTFNSMVEGNQRARQGQPIQKVERQDWM